MEALKRENTVLFLGFGFLAASLFGRSFHLPAWADMFFSLAGMACFVIVLVLRWRRKKSASTTGALKASQPIVLRIYTLFIIVGVTLSGPWWLPYTGVHQDFQGLMKISVATCIFTVSLFLIAWWYSTRKT